MRQSLFLLVLFAACLTWLVYPQTAQSQGTAPSGTNRNQGPQGTAPGGAKGNPGTSGQGTRAIPAKTYGPEAPNTGNVARQIGPEVRNVPATPRAPFPPLPPDHEKYLNDILKYWEQSSSDTKRYTCKFQRWEYEPVFGPRETYKTYSTGVIKYSAPDKGMFKVEKIQHYTPPASKDEKPKYVTRPDDFGDHWVCDGQSVFEFNYPKKQLIERQLPPDMRGQAIADGPLPFLFGAKADKIKERYWVRVVTPADAQGEYWLEAFPKKRADAANFAKVEIIIDQKDFLPKAIQVFYPGYDPKTNPVRAVFMFADRKKNGLVDPTGWIIADFSKPATPRGWEKIVDKYQGDEPEPPPAKGGQAQRLGGKPSLK